jgi:hypothetical protein
MVLNLWFEVNGCGRRPKERYWSLPGLPQRTPNHFPSGRRQRSSFYEVSSVSQRDGALRHDSLDSDGGNLPQAKGGPPPAASKAVLAAVKLNATLVYLFRRRSFFLFCMAHVLFQRMEVLYSLLLRISVNHRY